MSQSPECPVTLTIWYGSKVVSPVLHGRLMFSTCWSSSEQATSSWVSSLFAKLTDELVMAIKRSERRKRQYQHWELPDSKALLRDLIGVKTSHKLGFVLEPQDGIGRAGGFWRVKGQTSYFRNKHLAIQFWIYEHPRQYGQFTLNRAFANEVRDQRLIQRGLTNYGLHGRWALYKGADLLAEWVCRPTRKALAQVIRRQRNIDPRPSWHRADTLGWRGWRWNTRHNCLMSPSQGTLWDNGPEMRVTDWASEVLSVRNHAGVHACRLPRGDWRAARAPRDFIGSDVIGLVERFGRFVLGTEGWRAEWVIIRELLVCDEVTASKVREAYPEIPVGVAPKGHWMRRGDY